MQECSGFIGDGYEVDRYIRPKARVYPAVRLTVRLIETSERTRWSTELDRAGEDERLSLTAEWMAKRIVTWSLGAKPTVENIMRLAPALFDRIFAVIWGEDGGDPLPETGKTPENDREADAGNSQPG